MTPTRGLDTVGDAERMKLPRVDNPAPEGSTAQGRSNGVLMGLAARRPQALSSMDTGSRSVLIERLQAHTGNATVQFLVASQRQIFADSPFVSKAESRKAQRDEWAVLFGLNLSMLVNEGGALYGPGDAAALPDRYAKFLTHAYQAVHGTRFGTRTALSASEKEQDVKALAAMMPRFRAVLQVTPDGRAALAQLEARVSETAGAAAREVVMEAAHRDAALAAALQSPSVVQTREKAIEALSKGWDVYSKFSEQVSEAGKLSHPRAGEGLGLAHKGLDAGFALVKALDPASYRKAADDARAWMEKNKPGTAMTVMKVAAVEAELIDLTVGTLSKAGGALSSTAIALFGPKGQSLDMLQDLAKSGQLITTSGRMAASLGRVVSFLDKVDNALAVVSVAGGVAKFATAENKGERFDAAVKVVAGGVQAGAKFAGRKLLAAGAGSVLATWEMVKFFGEQGAAAIEGSFHGGLRQELEDMRSKFDALAKAQVILAAAIDERERRYGGADITDPARGAADEAVDDLAHRLQQALRAADKRWQDTRIAALGRFYQATTQVDVGQALQGDYPPDLVLLASQQFLELFIDAWRKIPTIVEGMIKDWSESD